MKKSLVVVGCLALACAAFGEVRFGDCPKCDKRIRISDDGRTATVNLAWLKDDAPDAATLGTP